MYIVEIVVESKSAVYKWTKLYASARFHSFKYMIILLFCSISIPWMNVEKKLITATECALNYGAQLGIPVAQNRIRIRIWKYKKEAKSSIILCLQFTVTFILYVEHNFVNSSYFDILLKLFVKNLRYKRLQISTVKPQDPDQHCLNPWIKK